MACNLSNQVGDDMVEEGGSTYGANPGVPEGDSGCLGTVGDERILVEPTPVDVVEIPDGVEFKPVGEDDGTVGRDDHPIEEDPELSPAPGEPKEDEYYVDARGVIRSEGEEEEGGDKHSISDKDDDPEPLPLEPPDPDPA